MFSLIDKQWIVVGSVLADPLAETGHPKGSFPPCMCIALAYWSYWESPEASKIAEGIMKARKFGKSPKPELVAVAVEPGYAQWTNHPLVTKSALPLGLAEHEAKSLLAHYKGKRLREIVGSAWHRMGDKPGLTLEIAAGLKLQLEECV